MKENTENLLRQIEEKYVAMGQKPEVHLEGLLWSKPITYWDYILPEALLSLQIQRTTQPDEMVFIMYHQINELLFKMILWEADQVAESNDLTPEFFAEKLDRISRYFDMLSSSFTIMGDGMAKSQYLKFRTTLTPASGFQSAQYRLIEFASTSYQNLIDNRFRAKQQSFSAEEAYEVLYWQAAGKDHSTGAKSALLSLFEEKYKALFLEKMEYYRHKNLQVKFQSLSEEAKKDQKLIQALRHYDYTVNVTWVMTHFHAAEKYLDTDGQTKEATGGSDWKKYMHPKYQRRIFFPEVWSEEEIKNWGQSV